jgi:hypothetical protein
MIAKTTSSRSFFPLAAYLAAGTDGRHPERVEWTAGRRLVVADLATAPAIMEATAYQSVRVERPCYHIVVSFDIRDRSTRGQMEEVADRVLGRLGLAEYQALLVAHNDRSCALVHVMVNRVHPETGIAWERWKDRHVIEAALREAERDLGMRAVPGRLSPALDRAHGMPAPREADLTWGERRLAERTGREPLLDRARDALTDCREARSWQELVAALAQRGLAIARTAKGIMITDGETRVRASRVAPDLGLPRLEARFAERFPDTVAEAGVDRVVGLVRLLDTGEAIERDARDAQTALQRARAELTAVQVRARQAAAHRSATQATERHVQPLLEAAAVAGVESATAHARKMCDLLARHRAGPQSPDKIREQLGVEVGRLTPDDLSVLRRRLAPVELARLESVSRNRERETSLDRSRD